MNVAQERTKSLWMDTKVAAGSPWNGGQKVDVVIIGAGIAGLSIAYELSTRGLKVIVLDRGQIAAG